MGNNTEIAKGYKVFNPDWTCTPSGGRKQYTCPGKFEEEIDLSMCGAGMHFCKRLIDCFNFNYSFDSSNKVAEVIAYGKVIESGNKCCTDKLEIVREIPWGEVLEIVNTGKDCTGRGNSGNWNSGRGNSGNRNSGDWNSGNRNSGDCNSGDCNSGDWNSGRGNSGDWNSGDWNSGCFNTKEQNIYLFDKPSNWTLSKWRNSRAAYLMSLAPQKSNIYIYFDDMTPEENWEHPEAQTTGGYLKVVDKTSERQAWWDRLSDKDKNEIKAIPNFDRDIFKEITGIDVGD